MADDLPIFKPLINNTLLVSTASTAIFTIPANTLVLKNLENQRKSYLDFGINELIVTGLSSLLLLLDLKLKEKVNY